MTERDRTYDGRIIAALRDLAASLHARGIDRTTLALDELDALLDAAAERDTLKVEGCAMPDEIHLKEGDTVSIEGAAHGVRFAMTEPRVVKIDRALRTPTAKSTKSYDCLHDPACRWGGHSVLCLNANA